MADAAWPPARSTRELVRRFFRRELYDWDLRTRHTIEVYLEEKMLEEKLLPVHQRWGVEYNGKDGRTMVEVVSEDAAKVLRAQLKKSRKAPLVYRWAETEKMGVPYDERDKKLLQ